MPSVAPCCSRLVCRFLPLLALLLQGGVGAAQAPPGAVRTAAAASRLAPGLAKRQARQAVRVSVRDQAAFAAWMARTLPEVPAQLASKAGGIFTLRDVTPAALTQLLDSPLVLFIDQPTRVAHDERLVNQADLTVNAIRAVHRHYPALTGRGLTVSVKENPIDPLDLDFRGRLLVDSGTVIESAHASIMATLIAGAGNTGPAGEGAAREARLVSHSYANLLPEPDAQLTQLGVSVQNHSYGTGIENYYGLEARDYDRQAAALPALLHVFSSGNSGLLASPGGAYQSLPAVANLTGQFKMSKNSLSVGATNALGQVAPQSSRGPAYDGRVKPELVAFGDAGSSDAAALVSGISLLVQHAYASRHGGTRPSSALVKAALLTSADDLGRPELDFVSGYGQADALGAVRAVLEGRHFGGQVAPAAEQTFELTVPPGTAQLKLTLAWTDPEAAPNAAQALVNDLDLELLGPAPGARWQPWVLSAYPHPDSLALPARRGADHLNNAEQITLRRPAAGRYRVRVRGFRVSSGASQAFSVAYEVTASGLEWLFPNLTRNLRPGQPTLLRWQWTGESASAQFAWRPVGQVAWRPLEVSAELASQTLTWTPPDTTTLAQLRAVGGGREFVSDTFALAPLLPLRVAYACATEALLTWPAVAGATGYQVYRLGATAYEPLRQTTDTLLVLPAPLPAGSYFAVAPRLRGRLIERSNAASPAGAGLSCYIRAFVPRQPVADTVRLSLVLSSLYRLQAIHLQRLDPVSGEFETIQTRQPVDQTSLEFTDLTARAGLNQYRIWGQDAAGRSFYSAVESVQQVRQAELLVYPVPARAGEPLQVVAVPGATLQLRLYDALGRPVRAGEGTGAINVFDTSGLRPGLYLLRARLSTGPDVTRRIVLE
ncbi:S8 family serine peptidase [uncultured Hymenobacter sp.]|uniref:S8 family serine peptidase n=1 Tax=uncultured Hymenobacter sp. TaxID=170016 RepID=UPI0035CA1235